MIIQLDQVGVDAVNVMYKASHQCHSLLLLPRSAGVYVHEMMEHELNNTINMMVWPNSCFCYRLHPQNMLLYLRASLTSSADLQ
jgi:hypothetical protein